MSEVVDARGLSCPQPVILALKAMKKASGGELEILVDTDTARENVTRAARTEKWQVKNIMKSGRDYRILLVREAS
ncbi:sulfurtransferase TusA family protein [Thermodesulforhabdus norvegica]|uniref:TusA-related sulfurtransferase n=1 Tax=Thermodesulforhabdus norvegica TaxID=39841 RepID=A0A1I4TSA7_9BACT|nr:sulfurtransferase TusA family protein [Thermodesulforhabdus norvegica]SFM79551.1 TusA-related sulfurtransferase [Thermodesulforhabdus norvegica]